MRVRRSNLKVAGIRRIRRGKGFSYTGPEGGPVEEADRQRIAALVIPPAWQDVWICPYPNGHIQAVGTDAAGRRQYIYLPEWREARDRAKHERVLELAGRLPAFRRAVAADLRRPGLGRERVVAVALRMLEGGMFRTGGEQYEVKYGSHGVATLLREHVHVSGDEVVFGFPSKSGQVREARLRDRPLARAVLALKRSGAPGPRLLQYREDGAWHKLGSKDVRKAFRALAGNDHSVKELRTWAATVAAAVALSQEDLPSTDAGQRRAQRAALVAAAEHLGNTPAVAGRSYVDPRVLTEFAAGTTLADASWRPTVADRERLRRGDFAAVRQREALERAVLRLLSSATPGRTPGSTAPATATATASRAG